MSRLSNTPRSGKKARDEARGAEAVSARSARVHNTQNSVPVSDKRLVRWDLRDTLRQFTSIPRVAKCGHAMVGNAVSVRCSSSGERAGFGGLSTCGSVWVCPVCSAKIAVKRRAEVEKVIDKALSENLHVSMLTLTQRHHKGQSLADLWDALAYAWRGVWSGRFFMSMKEQLGIRGFIKATELTHGKNGWHVHLHVLILSERDPRTTVITTQRKQGRRKNPYPVETFTPFDYVCNKWQAKLAEKNVDFMRENGADWTVAVDAKALANYAAKIQSSSSMANETTLGGYKKARGENRTPFQILEDIQASGDADDIDLFNEYERVSHGRRALIFSAGLRAWAGLADKTDEELAQEEALDETIAIISKTEWLRLRTMRPARLLSVIEKNGIDAGYRWLDDHEIVYLRQSPTG